jgi:hypothetical protein
MTGYEESISRHIKSKKQFEVADESELDMAFSHYPVLQYCLWQDGPR